MLTIVVFTLCLLTLVDAVNMPNVSVDHAHGMLTLDQCNCEYTEDLSARRRYNSRASWNCTNCSACHVVGRMTTPAPAEFEAVAAPGTTIVHRRRRDRRRRSRRRGVLMPKDFFVGERDGLYNVGDCLTREDCEKFKFTYVTPSHWDELFEGDKQEFFGAWNPQENKCELCGPGKHGKYCRTQETCEHVSQKYSRPTFWREDSLTCEGCHTKDWDWSELPTDACETRELCEKLIIPADPKWSYLSPIEKAGFAPDVPLETDLDSQYAIVGAWEAKFSRCRVCRASFLIHSKGFGKEDCHTERTCNLMGATWLPERGRCRLCTIHRHWHCRTEASCLGLNNDTAGVKFAWRRLDERCARIYESRVDHSWQERLLGLDATIGYTCENRRCMMDQQTSARSCSRSNYWTAKRMTLAVGHVEVSTDVGQGLFNRPVHMGYKELVRPKEECCECGGGSWNFDVDPFYAKVFTPRAGFIRLAVFTIMITLGAVLVFIIKRSRKALDTCWQHVDKASTAFGQQCQQSFGNVLGQSQATEAGKGADDRNSDLVNVVETAGKQLREVEVVGKKWWRRIAVVTVSLRVGFMIAFTIFFMSTTEVRRPMYEIHGEKLTETCFVFPREVKEVKIKLSQVSKDAEDHFEVKPAHFTDSDMVRPFGRDAMDSCTLWLGLNRGYMPSKPMRIITDENNDEPIIATYEDNSGYSMEGANDESFVEVFRASAIAYTALFLLKLSKVYCGWAGRDWFTACNPKVKGMIFAVSYWLFSVLSVLTVQPAMSMRTTNDVMYTIVNIKMTQALEIVCCLIMIPFTLHGLHWGCKLCCKRCHQQSTETSEPSHPPSDLKVILTFGVPALLMVFHILWIAWTWDVQSFSLNLWFDFTFKWGLASSVDLAQMCLGLATTIDTSLLIRTLYSTLKGTAESNVAIDAFRGEVPASRSKDSESATSPSVETDGQV